MRCWSRRLDHRLISWNCNTFFLFGFWSAMIIDAPWSLSLMPCLFIIMLELLGKNGK
jgi:hypothetical protein